jgi:D-glucosaminate-6-phosphate ammonia-lyase
VGSVFETLGVRPVINASGVYTDLGGSRISPEVWTAMTEMNERWVRMPDLLDRSGEILASRVGAEAARVTPGAAAAIMLGIAACMTGEDGKGWEQLPDTSGLRDEVVIQSGHRYKYDRQAWMTGARRMEIGTVDGTDPDELREVLTDRTAAILHPGHLDGSDGTLPLEAVAEIARARDVPIFVDAAYLNYPTSVMRTFIARGADLVCFSAKYFGGPNAGGFVAGRRDLLRAIAGIDFTRYESGDFRTYGRPLKLDRQIVAGVVLALDAWLSMDHEARFASYEARVDEIGRRVGEVPGVSYRPMFFTMDERLVEPQPTNCLVVDLVPTGERSADDVAMRLADGEPSIVCVVEAGRVVLAVDAMNDEEARITGDRLRAVLTG